MKKLAKILFVLTIFLTSINAKAEDTNMTNKKTLVVYFSKTGEQYSVGNITKGNTAIIAEMIADKTGADIFEVKLKNDNYPKEYEALTKVALSEKKASARPEIVGKVENFADYETVFIGTPNWWADLPMALYTFMEQYDWSDKTIVPFVTHEGSGLSSIPAKIKTTTNPKAMLEGLAIYGHVAQNSQDEAKQDVETWLKKIGF